MSTRCSWWRSREGITAPALGPLPQINRHPDLKGCVAVRETSEEALANLEVNREARRLWLETAYEHGGEIP